VTGDDTELHTVVDTTGPFSSFGGFVSLNNDGQVVFAANLAAGGRGIFSARDGVVDEIIGTGDSLFGSTVSSFPDTPFAPRALNNLGQLGFLANLADGRQVWVRADPDGMAPRSVIQVASLISGSDLSLRDGVSQFVEMTGPVQWPSMDTWALSNRRFVAGDPLRDEGTGDLSASVAASSSRVGGDVHERVFAEFEGDCLSADLSIL
jgi:hypothetical protein